MKLSVIMPVYNRERYVGPALRSLLRQRDAAELDVIVIDDGSTDGSMQVVRSLMQQADGIRIVSQANAGVTRARNAGLRNLRPETEFVAFLDSDDISPAGRFKADLKLFHNDPSLQMTYSRMTLLDAIDDDTMEPAEGCNAINVRGIHLSAGIFRRELIERTGEFDENFEQAEDTDYLLRIFESDAKFALSDTVGIYYRRHPGNMTKELNVSRREFIRAIHKSMVRRKANPTSRKIEGVFDFKDLAHWRFM